MGKIKTCMEEKNRKRGNVMEGLRLLAKFDIIENGIPFF